MSDRPSVGLQEAFGKAIAEAIIDSIDWDMTEKLLEPALKYVQRCLDKNLEDEWAPFYFSSEEYAKNERGQYVGTPYPDGLRVSFCITDEDAELVTTDRISLCEALTAQYGDSFQDQANILFGLERTLAEVRKRYREQFGFDCTPEAVAAERARRWPEQTPPVQTELETPPET